MIGGAQFSDLPIYLQIIAIIGGVAFYGRFYVQWIVSEIQKRSVMPVVFWYMSALGSLIMLAYGVLTQSPNGTLSHAFNMVVYARNLVLIWGEKEALSRTRSVLVHGLVACVILFALGGLAYTWHAEYETSKEAPTQVMLLNWTLIALGALGSVLFGCRFLIQWITSEVQKKSVVPVIFWYISIAASLLQLPPYLYRGEWLFALGLIGNIPLYIRNLWLVQHNKPATTAE